MKLKITKTVHDKLTGERFVPKDKLERPENRGKDFIKAGVAEELITPKKSSSKKK